MSPSRRPTQALIPQVETPHPPEVPDFTLLPHCPGATQPHFAYSSLPGAALLSPWCPTLLECDLCLPSP